MAATATETTGRKLRKPAGVAPGGDLRTAFTVRIPDALHDQLQRYRKVNDISVQNICTDALAAYFSADPAAELRKRTNPFHDASPREMELLVSAFELLRSQSAFESKGILQAVLMNWKRLKKIAS